MQVVEAISHRLKTGCQWRKLPTRQFFDVEYRVGNLFIIIFKNGQKTEVGNDFGNNSRIEAEELLRQVIRLYNEKRPHMSIGNLVPEKVHGHQLIKGDKKMEKLLSKKINL